MAINDLLVHLDGSDRDRQRTELALALATRFDARLTGLFARMDASQLNALSKTESSTLARSRQNAEETFLAAAAGEKVTPRFWHLSHGDPQYVVSESAQCARFFDMVVLGQRLDGDPIPADFIEHMVTHCGRPCLVAPAQGSFKNVGSNVVVAWNAQREATRALHDALPFIRKADKVEVLTVRKSLAEAGASHPPAHIADHLSSYGVKVVREHLLSEDVGVMDMLLSRAFDLGADLLVMGGQSSYVFPFFEGAGARHILRNMQLPVLMSR